MFNLYKSWLESRKDSITGKQSKDGKPSAPTTDKDFVIDTGDFTHAERTSRGKKTGRTVHGTTSDKKQRHGTSEYLDSQYDDKP